MLSYKFILIPTSLWRIRSHTDFELSKLFKCGTLIRGLHTCAGRSRIHIRMNRSHLWIAEVKTTVADEADCPRDDGHHQQSIVKRLCILPVVGPTCCSTSLHPKYRHLSGMRGSCFYMILDHKWSLLPWCRRDVAYCMFRTSLCTCMCVNCSRNKIPYSNIYR